MPDPNAVDALLAGDAVVDISSWRKIAVRGADAMSWLNDLLSSDLSELEPGTARRSLLLSPTGHVRAEMTVARGGDDLLMIQDPAQPRAIDALLERYVLSSDVVLANRSHELAAFALPMRAVRPNVEGALASSPSCVGVDGFDVLAATARSATALETLADEAIVATLEDLERWRIVAGLPRFAVDGAEEDLPFECGFGDAVAADKGCYLGQEAVARVRNLGHPRRALVHVASDAAVHPGELVRANGDDAGRITSAAEHGGRWWAFAKVKWGPRDDPLVTQNGTPLRALVRA